MKNSKRCGKHIYKITKEQLFDFQKPHYNGFNCGHGAFKNKKKYNRRNKDWIKDE